MIKIDKGIERPSRSKYPLKDLQVGDSFLLDPNVKSIYQNVWGMGKRMGMKFSVRVTSEGARVWRIK
jgi:hypothetical protein